MLSLLAAYAEEAPVAVVVDDLHLLDLPSAEAVVFAARRLGADPVVVLAAVRTSEADRLVAGLPVVHLSVLDQDAATALVTHAAGGPLVPGRLEPLLALAGGNPLALLELAGDDLDTLATDPSKLRRECRTRSPRRSPGGSTGWTSRVAPRSWCRPSAPVTSRSPRAPARAWASTSTR